MNPIYSIFTDIGKDISNRHHLRSHRKFARAGFDFDSDKWQNVGMGRVHPQHAFPAEPLDSVFRVNQSSRMGHPTALYVSAISEV